MGEFLFDTASAPKTHPLTDGICQLQLLVDGVENSIFNRNMAMIAHEIERLSDGVDSLVSSAPLVIFTSSSQNTTSTSWVTDNTLVFDVEADAEYAVQMLLSMEVFSGSGFKARLLFSDDEGWAGFVGRWVLSDGGQLLMGNGATTGDTIISSGVGAIHQSFSIITSGVSGQIKFQFCSNGAGSVTRNIGSWAIVHKVS